MSNAIGFVETRGYVAAFAAADAMVKAANVTILGRDVATGSSTPWSSAPWTWWATPSRSAARPGPRNSDPPQAGTILLFA